MDTSSDLLSEAQERAAALPMQRMVRWIAERRESRETAKRPCELNLRNLGTSAERCGTLITYRFSAAAGHRGFCSIEHAYEDQANRPM